MLSTLFKGLTDPLAKRPFGSPFQHAASRSLTCQHFEQHGVTHHGPHGSRAPGLGIAHGRATGNVGRLFPGHCQFLLVGEVCRLLILVDAGEGLAEGVARSQLVIAHRKHGLFGVHPRTANRPGRTSGDGCAGGKLGDGLGCYRLGNFLGRSTFDHGSGDSAAN
ncbi:hypothetical protein D3C76_1180810 [compost metagenome]